MRSPLALASFGGFGHLRARGTDRGGKRREMVSRPTRGERYRFGRRRRRRAGTREIDVVAAAASTTRRARESGGDVRQRSIGNRWELPPPLRPSLSVRPPKYLSTDDAVSPPSSVLPRRSCPTTTTGWSKRPLQRGPHSLDTRSSSNHPTISQYPTYEYTHGERRWRPSVRDGQMKPSDRSGN